MSSTRLYIDVPDDDANACAGALSRAVASALLNEPSPDERWLLHRVQLVRVEHDADRAAMSRAHRGLAPVVAALRSMPRPGQGHAIARILERFETSPYAQHAVLVTAHALYEEAVRVYRGGGFGFQRNEHVALPRYLERQRAVMDRVEAWLRPSYDRAPQPREGAEPGPTTGP